MGPGGLDPGPSSARLASGPQENHTGPFFPASVKEGSWTLCLRRPLPVAIFCVFKRTKLYSNVKIGRF